MGDEIVKLETHLKLLREEYGRLQNRYVELEKKYQMSSATGKTADDTFVSRIMKTVVELFESELYSDITIGLNGRELKGHKFVLAARSDIWGVSELVHASNIDLGDVSYDVGYALMKWVYTDQVSLNHDDVFLLNLLQAARRLHLWPLSDRCEQALTSLVDRTNCIRFYETAVQAQAELLKKHCAQVIAIHWKDLTKDDFRGLSASLAYELFKTNTLFPLHAAIRAEREDIVFLYLVEHDSQLPGKLNEVDDLNQLPLQLALASRQDSIANNLVKHGVDLNAVNTSGTCLLNFFIQSGDGYAAQYLIDNGCSVNLYEPERRQSALHLLASLPHNTPSLSVASIGQLLLKKGAQVNAVDSNNNTALHHSIQQRNDELFTVLLDRPDLDLECVNNEGHSVLWCALQCDESFTDASYAARLLKRGASPDALVNDTGDGLLHKAAREGLEDAALFLLTRGANVGLTNKKGETPLHVAAACGLVRLTRQLLQQSANPNIQTSAPYSDGLSVYKQTPLHLAVFYKHVDVINAFLAFKSEVMQSGQNFQIIPNLMLKDSEEQTILSVALWNKLYDIVVQLIAGGASVNGSNSKGLTLLHEAILAGDETSALFLLNQQADVNTRTKDNESCLQLAIRCHEATVVDALCRSGVTINATDGDVCPLWQALDSGQEDIADILVKYGCDRDVWSSGPNGCLQTLLHRAIDDNKEAAAQFLVRRGCDLNSPRKPGPNGEGGDEARDGNTPSHLCAEWGLDGVMQCLIERGADINMQNAEGKTALHIAIENQHPIISSLLLAHPNINLVLRDKQSQTAFTAAMKVKSVKTAQIILSRQPAAAEQRDGRGRNFLHVAVQKSDVESVLFLLSVNVNVNSHVQDSSQHTPLHLAVITGSEIIVRNLLLAGANINDRGPHKDTVLHLAALHDRSAIASILLENKVDFNATDDSGNNALHLAVQHGHLATTRVLLTESTINAEAANNKGQNALHLLGQYGKENAAAIFELFMECMPQYPINEPDSNGNTGLLLAYMNGNGSLCRSLVRAGASLGTLNKDGMSIFNFPVATKQLLFKLLDMLSQEPPWSTSEICLECATKFGLTTRKHHCRHCGRVLCSKCSDKEVPIIKFNVTKPTRVCATCFDVLMVSEQLRQ